MDWVLVSVGVVEVGRHGRGQEERERRGELTPSDSCTGSGWWAALAGPCSPALAAWEELLSQRRG